MLGKLAVSALILATIVGCASGGSAAAGAVATTPAPTVDAIVGTFTLVTVDGRTLPATPKPRSGTADPSAWTVVAGTMTFAKNGTFRIETTYNTNGAGSQSALAFSGSCYSEGDEIRMVWDGGGATNLAVRGDTMILKRDGSTYAYLRR